MESLECVEEWKEWLRVNAHRLLLFARQQTRSEADAQDVLQEAVIRVWTSCVEKCPPARPSPADVFGSIRRCAIDMARKETRRIQREQRYLESELKTTVWFESTLESEEQNRFIEESLRRIPESFREVIILRIWGELTFAEIAKALEIPVNTAASRYRYGLDSLRKQINQPVV